MDFKQLQSFVAVIKYNSFTEAAKRLYVSQPTISTHIRMLEEELNSCLIIRSTKSIEVTPRGWEAYALASSILEQRDRLLYRWTGDQKRILYIGASTIPSTYILPEVLPSYGELHPETYFLIHQSDSQGIIDGLLSSKFDVGLIGMECREEALTCVPFYSDRMVIITPVNEHFLELQAQPDLSVETLLKEPIILRELGSGSLKSANRFFEEMGITEENLQITARINNQESIKNLVASGLGISVISERAARNFLEEKRVLLFELPEHSSRRVFYLAFRKNPTLPSYVQDFTRFIKLHYADSLKSAFPEAAFPEA
ncbi:MAG: selenium metabolism-associated LysR family transcriptional regulator [Oscillospiraceae bacterium]